MTDISFGSDLLNGRGAPRQGSMDTEETLIKLVESRFPRRPYCLVQDWTIFKVEVTEDELKRVHAAAQLPLILFAHNVLFDSQRRFDHGDWVRSTMCVSFQDGFIFETRNTVYLLMGGGHEKTASFKTIMSIF